MPTTMPAPGPAPKSVAVPHLRPRDPVARAVLLALRTGASRIRAAEIEARRGTVEGIHRFRTATRRLRSELRAFGRLVDADWIAPMESELKWLAGLLGDVRDLDVLASLFREAAGEGPGAGALAPLFDDLTARHARASAALRAALLGDRYRDLLRAIAGAIDDPGLGEAGEVACRKALPPLAASVWRRLRKAARALRRDDPDAVFHEVRKRAKRARYIAELIEPVLSGSSARGVRRFIRGATRVQDVLGAHQDAVVAGAEVAELLGRLDAGPDFERAARRLIDIEADAAQSAREAFFGVWDKLDRKRSRRWIPEKAGG